jgi:hypothetical protein
MFDRPALVLARLKAPLRLVAAMLGAWLLLDLALYRSGLYYRLAEPESNTGAVVTTLMLLDREYRPDARNVLVFGDSRIGEGFSAKQAEAGDASLNFINVSVPGSTPRTWYYLMREAARRGYRFEAAVIGTPYQPPHRQATADWPLDPAHQAPLLGLRDLHDYPAGFVTAPMRERARHAILFPALAMRADTLAALAAPLERRHKLRKFRPGFLHAVLDYAGRAERMPDLAFDADGDLIAKDGLDPAQRALVESHLADLREESDPALVAANAIYLETWFAALARLADEQGARLLLVPLPRGPYADVHPAPAAATVLAALPAEHPNVQLLPADLFLDLERPAFFFDTLHLNGEGRARFSTRLGDALRARLGPEPR